MARTRSRSRRSSPRRRGSRKSGTVLLTMGAIFLSASLAGAFWWSGHEAHANAFDKQTLCPIAAGPAAMTAILVDVTDPLSPAQHSQLLARLEKEIDDAPRGTQFTVGLVSEDPANWGASEPLCKPQDAATANSFTQNAALIDQRYQTAFLEPLQLSLSELVSASGANQSPIMESLQTLVAESSDFVTYEGPRRLVLVTDLLQHSDVLSFYRGGNWESFRESRDYQRIGSTLEDTEVIIYQIPRPAEGVSDPAVLEDFWLRYFDRQGARLPIVNRLGDL